MVKVQSGATVTSAGEAITELEMKPDKGGEPTTVALGELSMFVIERVLIEKGGNSTGLTLASSHTAANVFPAAKPVLSFCANSAPAARAWVTASRYL